MAKEFENIETMQLPDVEDILEACYEVLDDLWKLDDFLYPQQRMIHLMDIIAHAVTRFIQSKLTLLDLWQGKYSEVDSSINQVLRHELFINYQILTTGRWKCLCHQYAYCFCREPISVRSGLIYARN